MLKENTQSDYIVNLLLVSPYKKKDTNTIKQTKQDIQQLLVELGLNNSEIEELKQYF